MAVQVTPFKGTRLSEIAIQAEGIKDRREGLRLHEIGLEQRGKYQDATIRQGEQGLAQNQQQLDQAEQRIAATAQQMGVDQITAERQMLNESLKMALESGAKSPQDVKTAAEYFLGQTLGPDYAKFKFDQAPEQVFTQREDPGEALDQQKFGLQKQEFDLKKQQLEATREQTAEMTTARTRKAVADADSAENKVAKERQVAFEKNQAAVDLKSQVQTLARELLRDEDTVRGTFGSFQGKIPQFIRGGGGTDDVEAKLDRLSGLLTLDKLKALKGSSSDKELDFLARTATSLANRKISDEEAINELKKIAEIPDRVVKAQSGAVIEFDE